MTLSFNTPTRARRSQVLLDDVGPGGVFRVYSGIRPATGAPPAGNVVMAEITLPDPPGSLTNGAAVFDLPETPATVQAAGEARWWRLTDAEGTPVIDGSLTETGAGGDLTTPSLFWEVGEPVLLSALVINEGND